MSCNLPIGEVLLVRAVGQDIEGSRGVAAVHRLILFDHRQGRAPGSRHHQCIRQLRVTF